VSAVDSIYVEVTGTTCHVDGIRGTVTGLQRDMGHLVGAFVRADETGAMLYVTLGAAVGERGVHREVLAVKPIDREEFDRLTGLAALRSEFGWRDPVATDAPARLAS